MLNNKTLCAGFVCLVVIVLTNSQVLSPSEKIGEHFYHKCFNRTHDLIPFQRLYNDTTKLIVDMSEAAKLIPDQKKTFCEVERKRLATSVEQVSKDLMPCLLPEETFLPEFLVSSVKEFLHFLCHNHGENMDRLFSAQGRTCTKSVVDDEPSVLRNCFGKIFPPVSEKYVTKRELCDNMGVAKKCLNLSLDRKCPQVHFMHELNEKFFHYVGKTCSGCVTNYLSTLLLIMSVVLPFTFNH